MGRGGVGRHKCKSNQQSIADDTHAPISCTPEETRRCSALCVPQPPFTHKRDAPTDVVYCCCVTR